MEIEIDFTKNAQQNAQDYFSRSKKAKHKAEGAEKSINELKEALNGINAAPKKGRVLRYSKKEWYEKFNWFFTSNSLLAIGGRSAQQNELINSKYFLESDLFFHADVFGASVTILKDGAGAPREVKEEVAQFAACYSKAWEEGSAANVYSLKRDQVSKSKEKGSLGTGSFLLSGEREWYKNVPLELAAFMEEKVHEATPEKAMILPLSSCKALGISNYVRISPGNTKKSDAAKLIAKRLGYEDIDYIMQHLPAGSFSIK
ncbi:MAG: NFACT RNA binding domain-containing protein [Candidatus Marsarchaeota archaeon]|jgi:predicted ribosome quality control (RQC) complex YloA/Tae2 family protein|nr:NFACT RNA binding domain-containing protein [Candidatus Marsarchaeota archaeon]